MTFHKKDKSEVSGAVVMMLKGANSNLVIKDIKKKISKSKKHYLKVLLLSHFLTEPKWSTILFRQLRKTYWKER
jgi:cobalt-zinc-cadmium resistance protein CzcA